jgi:hypothetical protein
MFKDGYDSGVGYVVVSDGPPAEPRTLTTSLSDPETGFTETAAGFWPGYPSDPPPRIDVSGALGVGVLACGRPVQPLTGTPLTFRKACGAHPDDPANFTGIPGMTIELLPHPAAAAGPTYSNAGANPLAGTTSAEGGFSFFLNVPPGDYEVVLHPPPGKTLNCTADLLDDDAHTAWDGAPAADGPHYQFRVEPGTITGTAFLYCDATP